MSGNRTSCLHLPERLPTGGSWARKAATCVFRSSSSCSATQQPITITIAMVVTIMCYSYSCHDGFYDYFLRVSLLLLLLPLLLICPTVGIHMASFSQRPLALKAHGDFCRKSQAPGSYNQIFFMRSRWHKFRTNLPGQGL